MTAKEKFLQLYPGELENFVRDILEEYYNKEPDLSAEESNDIVERQQLSEKNDLKYSNEYRFNSLLLQLLDFSQTTIFKEFIDRTYIGIRKDTEVNAEAIERSGKDDYFLIAIHFGLYNFIELVCDTLGRISVDLMLLKEDYTNQSVSTERALLKEDIEVGVRKIKNRLVSPRLKISVDKDLQLMDFKVYDSKIYPNFLAKVVYKLKPATTLFIIMHEIGHHKLEHTLNRNVEFLDDIPASIKKWKDGLQYNEDQKMEFEADSFALLFFLTMKYDPSTNGLAKFPVGKIHYAIGAIVTFLALALFELDINCESESHPSIKNRILNIANISKFLLDEKEYNLIKMTIVTFIEYLESENSFNFLSEIKSLF